MREHKITDQGIYILEIYVPQKIFIKTSKNGDSQLSVGFYYYIGSAQKNLLHRLNRHIKKEKIIHWHIDQITANKYSIIKSIAVFENKEKDFECELCKKIEEGFNLLHPIKFFGNTDCKKCVSHLLYSAKPIDYNHFSDLYHSMVSFIPLSSGICDT
ncbi:MAG: GIY-YIG nuclease family protein [bacterium]